MKKVNAIASADLEFGSIGIKTLTALLFLMISALHVYAQKSTVLEAFSKHNIDAGILNADNLQQPDNYAYDLRQTTVTEAGKKVIIAKFDPSNPKEEQWTVVSVDGKSPARGDINSFRKSQNKEAKSTRNDESSYKIEKETSDYLVISYKQDPGAAKDAAFMKDCRLFMTVNLKTKKLEQVQVLNEKPLKIKILNAEKFDLIMKYNWNDQAKRYLTVSEDLNILAKFLGKETAIQTLSEYSNYTGK